MAFRTEISLEELLADPMVKLVMCRDGFSTSEARAQGAARGGRGGRQDRYRPGHAQAGPAVLAADGDRGRVAGHRHRTALRRPVRPVRGGRGRPRQRPVRGQQAHSRVS